MSHSTCKGLERRLGVITRRDIHSNTGAEAKAVTRTGGIGRDDL